MRYRMLTSVIKVDTKMVLSRHLKKLLTKNLRSFIEEFQSNSKGMEHKLEEISEIEETF